MLVSVVLSPPARASAPPTDDVRAVNVVPPGESGFVGATGSQRNTADQLPLYAAWQYKPMQFDTSSGGVHPGGDVNVTVARDHYGVPRIDARDDRELFYGMGYAMGQDRLWQMEVSRHVGEGTLAQLLGATGLPSDELVRRTTEGSARNAEFTSLPAPVQRDLQRFTDGVNQAMTEAQGDPSKLPAEFALFKDLPIAPWTVGDTLAYQEYAGRFFGEFGMTELLAARVRQDLVGRLGQTAAAAAFNDLYCLNDPRAPHTIPDTDGTFPRHVAGPPPANATPCGTGSTGDQNAVLSGDHLTADAQQLQQELQGFKDEQHRLQLPRLGSNALLLSGSRTADGNPLLYSGPQTGFSAPGLFWEAEVHDPSRDARGVFVPGIPVMVIGRNASAGWGVTSGLDVNADTFVDQLDPTNSFYVHNGVQVPVQSQVETIPCTNSPLGGPPCPSPADTITVWRDPIHGPALMNPDASHQLFVTDSAADGHFAQSFMAWDQATLQHRAAAFGASLAPFALSFNFFFADAAREIAYYHVGRYPIRPSNIDPRLPIPGSGPDDWQGFERYQDQPHDINPSTGALANWNNKPARDWVSKATVAGSGAPAVWGVDNQVVPLQRLVSSAVNTTVSQFEQFPRDVAYLDNMALVLRPVLAAALARSSDPQLAGLAPALAAWDSSRDHVDGAGNYDTPAIVFFDRWLEYMVRDTLGPALGNDLPAYTGLACSSPPCHFVSVDNLDAPTYKLALAAYETLINALAGHTQYDFVAADGATKVVLTAARQAADEIQAAQGTNVAAWTEPAEKATFQPLGAVSVPSFMPLPNRGSYGQVIEPLAAHRAS